MPFNLLLRPAVRAIPLHRAMSTKAARFAPPVDQKALPKGFVVASTYAGIKAAISPKPVPDAGSSSPSGFKASPKPDLALIVSAKPAAAAGTFTKNAFKAAPVVLSMKVLIDGGEDARVRSVLVNSGCANAVTGEQGMSDAVACSDMVASALTPSVPSSSSAGSTLLLSTGVIGVPLPMPAIKKCIPHLTSGNVLSGEAGAWQETARAFMTTDTFPKLRARTFKLGGRECRIVGIDKGAGMIHPNMSGPLHATMLGLMATDAPIAPSALQTALEHAVSRTFNCISVDGDMSTNDTIIALANGLSAPSSSLPSGVEITASSHPSEYAAFQTELTSFCQELAQLIVRDGEGAEKFVEISVKGAPSWEHAHAVASSVSTSSLVKCALHGGDVNWGRILCAVGYAPLPSGSTWRIDPTKVTVSFLPPPGAEGEHDELVVLKDGAPQPIDEAVAGRLLALEDICISIDLQGGSSGPSAAEHEAKYWTCDLSKEYVAINGDYRS